MFPEYLFRDTKQRPKKTMLVVFERRSQSAYGKSIYKRGKHTNMENE